MIKVNKLVKKSYLSFFLILMFVGSSRAVSTYAPDQLALTPGSYSKGLTFINIGLVSYNESLFIEYDTTFKVMDILDYPDVAKKLLLFDVSLTILNYPSNDYFSAGLVFEYEYLVWYHNRSIAVPMSYIKITNGSIYAEASLMEETTFAGVSDLNNMVVSLSDGREFLWQDFLSISALGTVAITLRDFLMTNWLTEIYFDRKEQYAISPEVSVGSLINYGWFDGEVVNIFSLNIGGKSYEVIKVHVDKSDSSPIQFDETEFLYESKIGLLANFTQFTETGEPYSQYTAQELYIDEPPDNKNNTITILYDYLFGILGLGFMVCWVYLFKQKKEQN